MVPLLQVLTVMVVALPTALAVAHALEHPGKMRLDEAAYRTVQRIYYPGFTVGGFAEPVAVLLAALLLFLTPAGTSAFWLVLVALLSMAAMHAVYWIVTHPVNRAWMAGHAMGTAGASFFGQGRGAEQAGWTGLRDRWERSHVARAVLGGISLLALVTALALQS